MVDHAPNIKRGAKGRLRYDKGRKAIVGSRIEQAIEAGMRNEALRPWCFDCGWRKGGVDSWNGVGCKCGHNEPPLQLVAPLHCACCGANGHSKLECVFWKG